MIRSLLFNTVLALIAASAAVVSALVLFKARQQRLRRGYRLPPGPVPLPFVGNVLSIDARKPWVTYTEWGTRYGDIFTVQVLQQSVIVINSEKIARELFERRSKVYSDRPHIATRIPFGWSFNFGFAPYGDQWRLQRRIFHQAFRAEAALAFRPTQLRKAHNLVSNILDAPHDYCDHVQRYSAAVIMSIVYDYEVAPSGHDYLVDILQRGSHLAMESLTSEVSCIVETLPFLLKLPEWFPGAFLSRKAAISKACATQMVELPFEHARKREADGGSGSAMARDLLKRSVRDPSQLELWKETCATAFVAGEATTSATLQCFILSMLQHPRVQERAQAEIDTVVGTSRLPDFDDRPNLPYLEAILLETLRTYSIVPLGVAHASLADDIYEDMIIPKGSTIFPNVWCMHHNEDVYPEPYSFKPERFLENGKLRDGVKSVDSLVYGFGRRVCPGRYNADGSIWIGMALLLSAFKIAKALDEHGEEIEVDPEFSYSLIPIPEHFPCSFTPRLPNRDLRKLSSTVEV